LSFNLSLLELPVLARPRAVWRSHGWLQYLAAFVFISSCYWLGLQPAFHYDAEHAKVGPSIRMDLDTNDLTNEIQTVPSIDGASKWWMGSWLPKVRYFRPLTITLFWIESKVWGLDGRVEFTWIHRISIAIFLGILFGFFRSLVGPARAMLATGAFAAGWSEFLRIPAGLDAYNCWKDDCDTWCGWTLALAAWVFLSYLRTGRRCLGLLAFGIWLIGLSLKETAYCLPILLVFLLLADGQLSKHYPRLAPYFLFAPLAWCYRYWALQGRFDHTGSNGSWTTRLLENAFGMPPTLVLGDGAPAFIVCSLAVLWLGYLVVTRKAGEPAKIWLVVWSVALAFAYYKTMHYMDDTEASGWLRFMNLVPWIEASYFAVWLAMWAIFFAYRNLPMRYGLAWMAAIFIPLAYQPPTSLHVYFLLAPGWSLFLTEVFLYAPAWFLGCTRKWGLNFTRPSLAPTGSVPAHP